MTRPIENQNEKTDGNDLRAYRIIAEGIFRVSPALFHTLRTWKNNLAAYFLPPFLNNVRRANFHQLARFGYVVKWVNDGSIWCGWDEETAHDIFDEWKRPQGIIVPTVAILRNATLYRDGSALLTPKRGHHDQYIFFPGSWYQPGWLYRCEKRHFLKQVAMRTQSHRSRISISGRCFSTRMQYSSSPGHFIHDVLSRIYYEELGIIVRGRDKIIAPKFHFHVHKVLFERIFEGYDILFTPEEDALEVEELIIPANLCGSWQFNPKGIEALAKRLRRITAPYVGPENYKVCISRKDGSNKRAGRNFENYEEFENLVNEWGYKIVNVSELSTDAQFSLWANTTDLIGVHGSGMINSMMMPCCGRHTEITGAPYYDMNSGKIDVSHMTGHICLIRLARAIGHKVRVIPSMRDMQNRSVIDLDQVKRYLIETSDSA